MVHYVIDNVQNVAGRLLELHLSDLGRLRRLDRVEDGFSVVAHLVFDWHFSFHLGSLNMSAVLDDVD